MKKINTLKSLSFTEKLACTISTIIILINFVAAIEHLRHPDGMWFAALHILMAVSFAFFSLHYYLNRNLAFSVYGALTVSSLYSFSVLYLNHFSLYSYFFSILLPIATYLILSYKDSLLYTILHYTVLTLISLYAYNVLGIESQAFSFIALKIYIFIATFIIFFGMLYHITISQNYNRLQIQNDKKELALSEIHHRIKNNLNLISSLLSVENFGSNDNDYFTVLETNRARIEAISLIHKLLYMQKNFDSIHFESYVDELCHYFFKKTSMPITLQKDIDELYFPIKNMQHFGIILTELIENSIQHAFENMENPKIFIALKKINEELYFIYRDNGKGCQESSLFNNKTLGMTFINTSIQQLKGKSTFECDNGLKCGINLNSSLLSEDRADQNKGYAHE